MKEKSPFYISLGERIRLAREASGRTQERLAEDIDVSIQFVSDLERGVVGLSIPTLVKLCQILHVSSDYLLFGSGDNPNLALLNAKFRNATPEELMILNRGVDLLMLALDYQNTKKE